MRTNFSTWPKRQRSKVNRSSDTIGCTDAAVSKTRGIEVDTNDPKALAHVHVCRHCGTTQRRDDVDVRAVALGVIECPACGQSSSLDVQIIAAYKAAIDTSKGDRDSKTPKSR